MLFHRLDLELVWVPSLQMFVGLDCDAQKERSSFSFKRNERYGALKERGIFSRNPGQLVPLQNVGSAQHKATLA